MPIRPSITPLSDDQFIVIIAKRVRRTTATTVPSMIITSFVGTSAFVLHWFNPFMVESKYALESNKCTRV
ncbi:hypothetical protein NPIL_159011 [Nephila pilipes]|uniref:Uncharacterized protein n=1 Tax=Nephila pilipes TaxID=299642 RepID=A0A8X6TW16_NEPPI|nr:hypothetical protein NPIL_159011 [Nephila pilipes]